MFLKGMLSLIIVGIAAASGAITSSYAFAEEVSASVKAKLEEKFKLIEEWAADPVVVQSVKKANAIKSQEFAAMTQEKWKTLTVMDPFVKAFIKNPLGNFLKQKKAEDIAEIFVSAADGTKVAITGKTTYWMHKGKPKHDEPMAGKHWTGPLELDESSGMKSIQISVPVLSGKMPIGSLVVGFKVDKL